MKLVSENGVRKNWQLLRSQSENIVGFRKAPLKADILAKLTPWKLIEGVFAQLKKHLLRVAFKKLAASKIQLSKVQLCREESEKSQPERSVPVKVQSERETLRKIEPVKLLLLTRSSLTYIPSRLSPGKAISAMGAFLPREAKNISLAERCAMVDPKGRLSLGA
jgi:hypothetical protein